MAAGSKIKNAKNFNNCIAEPFFKNFPLFQVHTHSCTLHSKFNLLHIHVHVHSQVCPPGLHITLGIFMRLFVLLENACHDLDLRAHMQGTGDHGPSYQRYADALQQLTQRKDEELSFRNGLQVLQQLLTHGLVSGAFTASDPTLLMLSPIFSQHKHGYNNS